MVLQEYALFGEFTVRETLQYFGRIYGMQPEEIKSQTKFLIQLLDLPAEKSRFIRSFRFGPLISLIFNQFLIFLLYYYALVSQFINLNFCILFLER